MQRPLDGVTLVVTRPAAQAARFIELARGAGAQCLAFPTLRITPLPLAADRIAQLQSHAWDWGIWTSTNAVELGWPALREVAIGRHAAVGRATERALQAQGLTVAVRPDNANSEGLLGTPELHAVHGQRVLLVKGAGGRDLLRETLAARGAHVETLEVYRREQAVPTDAALHSLHAALETRPIVTATSVDVLAALLELAGPSVAAGLRGLALVVPGARVAAAAQQLGWRGAVTVAATAEDDAMLAACIGASGGRPPIA
jgi:uroporphyrinogen-III synthase